MKTSFSVKVTGSITVSIEPSNEDGGGGGAADVDDNSGNVLVDVLLKSLVNDAIKKYAGDNGTTVDNPTRDCFNLKKLNHFESKNVFGFHLVVRVELENSIIANEAGIWDLLRTPSKINNIVAQL
ncbi:hypothetical protein FRACYDRAFT_237370 [Fragilariopsis cylindrus CCMP1102]|uniref:Uncharacterized protein n=1 Tax=Fragilariopsis cylindrus CCMP1102 TaxID=635003 RepID=A0A1E7FLR4_9STRA|nr:hypothetical protein FRACYDRAFT_237370 [Fragilariopsis cylindrus CCMP1102]|eukprot:OEU19077.1 hypothetical protein FRACYDRAFT_237370 [Fragilariopsis cylindrus CCMP1102]